MKMIEDNNLIGEQVKVEETYDASVNLVWQALTDNKMMKQWYFDLPEFKAEPGFEFEFKGGKDPEHQYLHICRVVDVEPLKKLSYTWRYEGYEGISHVTFELFDENGKTRLVVSHEGIETFKPANDDLKKENFEEGWKQILGTSLKEFLENQKSK